MGLVDAMREQLQGKTTTDGETITDVVPAKSERQWMAPGGVRLPSAQGKVVNNGPSGRRIIISYRDAGGMPRAWAAGAVEVLDEVTACAAQHLAAYVNERRALGETLSSEDFTPWMQVDTSTLPEGDLVIVPLGGGGLGDHYGTQVAKFVGYSRRTREPRVFKWSAASQRWTSTARPMDPAKLMRWASDEDLRRVHLTPADVRNGGAA